MPENVNPMWETWLALGWSQRDIELLRAHAGAMGIQVAVPTLPARIPTPTPRPYIPPTTPQRTQPPMRAPAKAEQNYINHVVIVLDASGSMLHLRRKVIQVTDELIQGFARESEQNGQETRVTVVLFNTKAWVVIYDKDVLRMPSIADHYMPEDGTALIDATMMAIDDLMETPQKHGDHAFVMYVITDGEENSSRTYSAYQLRNRIRTLASNWTFANLAPDAAGVNNAERYGFPSGNIKQWDAKTAQGVENLKRDIQAATSSYMTARATGTRSVTNLFDISSAVVNAQSIAAANLTHVPYDDYSLVPIPPAPGQVKPDDWDVKHPRTPWKAHGGRIDEFIQNVNGGRYLVGQGFYELTAGKSERIQPDKLIAVVDNRNRVYFGRAARDMLNLPDMEVRVKPSATDDYRIYVQSKSPNRKLVVGAKLLIFAKVPRESDYR